MSDERDAGDTGYGTTDVSDCALELLLASSTSTETSGEQPSKVRHGRKKKKGRKSKKTSRSQSEIVAATRPPTPSEPGTNWNEQFQRLVVSTQDVDEEIKRADALRCLCVDFAETARAEAVVIIRERELPDHMKSIPPVTQTVGGVAGGEKYLSKETSIFYKFALDTHGLYGSTSNAVKSANAELRGAMALLECRVSGLHLPLVALIHLRGMTLVAQSLLPIDHTTLLYGSADGRLTVRASSPQLNEKIKLAASLLNLAPHHVRSRSSSSSSSSNSQTSPCTELVLYGPGDLEGHLGHDKRFYIVDASRLFPPTDPHGSPRSYLYYFLRPEFVQRYHEPLSSDAFSPWASPTDQALHDGRVQQATLHLETVTVPRYASLLDGDDSAQRFATQGGGVDASLGERGLSVDMLSALVQDLHFHGINCRYLYMIFALLTASHSMRCLLATEIVARLLKNQVRAQWRRSLAVDDAPYATLFARQWAATFVAGFPVAASAAPAGDPSLPTCEQYARFLSAHVRSTFVQPRSGDDSDDSAALLHVFRRWVSPSLLGERWLQLTGVQLRSGVDWTANAAALGGSDVASMSPVIKPMSRSTFDEGTALSRLAMTRSADEADRLLAAAAVKYREALLIRPNDHRALLNWGRTLLERAKIEPSHGRCDSLCSSAGDKFQLVLQANPHNPHLRARVFFEWGSSLLDVLSEKKKQQRTSTERAPPRFLHAKLAQTCDLLSAAAAALAQTAEAPVDPFACAYNAGTAHLQLASLSSAVSSSTAAASNVVDVPKDEACRLLRSAIAHFEHAARIEPDNVSACRNLATASARLARLVDDRDEQLSLFQSAMAIHDKLSTIDPHNPHTAFDHANCLFRFASVVGPGSADMLLDSLDKYLLAVRLQQRRPGDGGLVQSAFVNVGMALIAVSKHLTAGVDEAQRRQLGGHVEAFFDLAASQPASMQKLCTAVAGAVAQLPDDCLTSAARAAVAEQCGRLRSSQEAALSPARWSDGEQSSPAHTLTFENSGDEQRSQPCSGTAVYVHASLPRDVAVQPELFEPSEQLAPSRSCPFPRFVGSLAPLATPLLLQVVPKQCIATLPGDARSSLLAVDDSGATWRLPLLAAWNGPGALLLFFAFDCTPLVDHLQSLPADTPSEQRCWLIGQIVAAAQHGAPLRVADLFVDSAGRVRRFVAPVQLDLAPDKYRSAALSSSATLQERTFCAPEILRGDSSEEGVATSMWTFGVLTYLALFGRLPFGSVSDLSKLMQFLLQPDPIAFPPHCPRDAAQLLADLLALDPRQRPTDWRHVACHPFLAPYSQHQSPVALPRPAPPAPPAAARVSRRELWKIVADCQPSARDGLTTATVETLVSPGLNPGEWSGQTIVDASTTSGRAGKKRKGGKKKKKVSATGKR